MARLARAEKEVAEEFYGHRSSAVESSSAVARGMASSEPAPAKAAVPVMTGTHFHGLDEKGRVIIPAKLRPALTEHFWMILDENDNITFYDYWTGMDVLEYFEQMMAEHPGDEDIAGAVERVTGTAEEVKVESSFRVQVPEILRFHAQLDKEVVTVGVLNHAVMWSRERWEEAQTRRLQSQEVRRAQAMMLRAAASGIKKKAAVRAAETEIEEKADVAIATGTSGIGTAGVEPDGAERVVRGTTGRAANPPAGDGGRSPRVLTLSQLGR